MKTAGAFFDRSIDQIKCQNIRHKAHEKRL